MVSAPYMQPAMDRFRPWFEKHGMEIILPPVNERMSEEELLRWAADVDGAICGDDRFTEKVLKACPRLKVISKWGTGIDSINKEAAARLGIAVKNTPNAFTEPVADTVLGYILCFARQLPWMDRFIREGRWHKLPSASLRERTLGVIGVGNIGKAVVRRARGFGMTVLGNDVVEIPGEFLRETGIRMVPREELLQNADFVSLNCDLNPTSFHILGGKELGMMKREAVVVNTARGPLIDQPALVEALREGRIAGAALDVFEEEPLPLSSPLRKMPNVLLAPHNANSSPMAWERVHENTLRNLLEGLGSSVRGGAH